ncbi:hypothetical protein MRB53_040111 [Persea americana]|nr:hypothetical protein MRB53_040111 [Persea americana]
MTRQSARSSPSRGSEPPRPTPLSYKSRPRLPSKTVAPNPLQYRRVPLVAGGLIAFAIPVYCGYIYLGYTRDAERYATSPPPLDTLRKKLAAQAKGHVLEVSAGTGRNMEYYPLTKGIKSVTLVDKSHEMTTKARIKWAKTNAWFTNAVFRSAGRCRSGALPQSAGVRHGHTNHGNRTCACRTGTACWFNKDVGRIVEASGLEVVEAKRFHFGTNVVVELKPRQRTSACRRRARERRGDNFSIKAMVGDNMEVKASSTTPY